MTGTLLAALLLSTLSAAVSIAALMLVLRRPRPPKITQFIHIPEPWDQVAASDKARAAARYPLPAAVTTRTATAPTTGRRAARKDPS